MKEEKEGRKEEKREQTKHWRVPRTQVLAIIICLVLVFPALNLIWQVQYKKVFEGNPCELCTALNPLVLCPESGKNYNLTVPHKPTVFLLNHIAEVRYKAEWIQLPCRACVSQNPELKPCFDSLNPKKRNESYEYMPNLTQILISEKP